MLGGADNPNGELLSYIIGADRGDMIAVGHSECEQYFVLFNIVLCSSMFFYVHRQG